MEVDEVAPLSKTERRAPWIELLGAVLAVVYVVLGCWMLLVFGLVGMDGDEVIGKQLIVGVVLFPLAWLAVAAMRESLPKGARDPLLIGALVLLALIAILRSFNVGYIGVSWSGIPIFLMAFLGAPWLSSFAIADLFRFRSPRLAIVALLIFGVLAVPSPGFGFSLANECLDAQVETVLADVAVKGTDSDFVNSRNEEGRCGVVAWSRLKYVDEHGEVPQVIFYNAGGPFATVDGFVWSAEPLDGCRDIDIYPCRNSSDLGNGWHSYELATPGAN